MKCDKAGYVSDKAQYLDAYFWEKIKLYMHLFFCKFCREYVKNNTKLSEAFVRSDLKTMTHNDKQKLKKTLYEEMLKEN